MRWWPARLAVPSGDPLTLVDVSMCDFNSLSAIELVDTCSSFDLDRVASNEALWPPAEQLGDAEPAWRGVQLIAAFFGLGLYSR